jgi:hypothetical protein
LDASASQLPGRPRCCQWGQWHLGLITGAPRLVEIRFSREETAMN